MHNLDFITCVYIYANHVRASVSGLLRPFLFCGFSMKSSFICSFIQCYVLVLFNLDLNLVIYTYTYVCMCLQRHCLVIIGCSHVVQ